MSDYVTAAEAADMVGCSGTHIRDLIQSGDLDAEKNGRRWRILRADVEALPLADVDVSERTSERANERIADRRNEGTNAAAKERRNEGATERTNEGTKTPPEWRDDLLAQVARLEADKIEASRREQEAGKREERSKARIIDLERAATVRESRIADLETAHASELSELRGQVAILEAKVRETLEERAEENGQLANRIADLVTAHTEMQARVVELQPVAERVPMLEAAVDEKDAALFERERRLSDMRADIEAIASRPVAGPMFRYLTRGKLRR